MNRVFFVCAVVLAVFSGAWAYEVFEPVQDSYVASYRVWEYGDYGQWFLIGEYFQHENYGDSVELLAEYTHEYSMYYQWEYIHELYVQFDISQIDSYNVNRASFNLFCIQKIGRPEAYLRLSKINSIWEEMTITYNTRPNTLEIDLLILDNLVQGEYFSLDIPVEIVQQWIDEPDRNFGLNISDWALRDDGRLIVSSRESSYPPFLEVWFEKAEGAAIEEVSWGEIKAAFE